MSELNKINKNNAFKVPENYFDNFSAELETRISEENLRKKFGNKNPFTVPENYFETFSVKIIEPKRKLIQIIKPWLSAAAGIIVIFALWQFLLVEIDKKNHAKNNNYNLKFEDSYIVNNQININENDIKYLEPEIDAFIDETDANQIYEYSNENTELESDNTEEESVYEYFIDYADDNDFTELLAEL